ncbi:MAG: hypothetical protein V1933_02565 [Candidatus Omnitrophota bacterium]
MAEFNLRCQMRYPKRCDLPIAEKERLEGPEKYKAFLMYQFDNNDGYLKETLKEYFKTPSYFLYDADDIRGLGVKFCKICKLAQASDFGIAVLSPENENVFMEVGLLIGIGKPCLYIVNESKLKYRNIKQLPFDISDQITVKYDSKEKLLSELEKEVPIFTMKVQLVFGCEKAVRETVKKKIGQLSTTARDVLKKFVSLGEIELLRNEVNDNLGILLKEPKSGAIMEELRRSKFVKVGHFPSNSFMNEQEIYSIEKAYRLILQELLFND